MRIHRKLIYIGWWWGAIGIEVRTILRMEDEGRGTYACKSLIVHAGRFFGFMQPRRPETTSCKERASSSKIYKRHGSQKMLRDHIELNIKGLSMPLGRPLRHYAMYSYTSSLWLLLLGHPTSGFYGGGLRQRIYIDIYIYTKYDRSENCNSYFKGMTLLRPW